MAVLLLWVAACADIATRRIRNWISLSLVILFLPFAALTLHWTDTVAHFLAAAAVFTLFFAGFALRKVGGGDVKLATAVMLWAGPETGLDFLFLMALSGGLLALFFILPLANYGRHWIARHLYGVMPSLADGIADRSVPYGVAIAIGGTFALHPGFLPFLGLAGS